ncbi:MAG: tyrosine-type recombinase/integrase [Acidimicrobiaceae bacterium]|nr:site-specific integrase [Acidimicrobiia bacterium]MCY4495316.1 tyrosine-type recombinase/integrase [Acidimicrobiaceae bacterium]
MTTAENAANVPTARDIENEAAEILIARGRTASRADNTRKTYATGWSSLAHWASANGVSALPADPMDLVKWLAVLINQGKKPATVRTYLAAVAERHSSRPEPNPAHDPIVRELLDGINRTCAAQGCTARQAAPSRWSHIERIIDTAHHPRHNRPGGRVETAEQAAQRARVDIAMITLAHDAAMRCSELLALRWIDIETPEANGLHVVRIRRSKTDQTGRGAVAPISDFTAQAIARIRPDDADPQDLIFNISASTVTRRMKAAAKAASIDPTNITSHSTRVGLAQDLAAHGVDMAGLTQAGRWKSAATARRYTEHLSASETPVGQYLKTQHHQTPPR